MRSTIVSIYMGPHMMNCIAH